MTLELEAVQRPTIGDEKLTHLSEADLEQISDGTDILEVVGREVELKQTGTVFAGICPFCPSMTASFTVHLSPARFHCSKCDAHGDVIDFVSMIEGIPRQQAARHLSMPGGSHLQASPRIEASPPPPIEEWEQEEDEFHPMSIEDLTRSAPPVEYLVEDILPKGRLMMLTASPGVGKTWLGLDMAIAIATARPWLGHFACKSGKVLLIDEESDTTLLRDRVGRLLASDGIDASDVSGLQFLSMKGVNLSDNRSVERLERVIRRMRPDLVFIDSLIRVHRANESSSEDMAPISAILKSLSTEFGCAICFTHHDRKPGINGHSSQHAFRGSSEIQALVDTHLDLTTTKGDGVVLKVRQEKRRYGLKIPTFCVEIADEGEGTVVRHTDAPPMPPSKIDLARDFIRRLGADGSRLYRQAIVERGNKMGHARNTLDAARRSLIEAGEFTEELVGNQTFIIKAMSSSSSPLSIGEEEKMLSHSSVDEDLLEVRVGCES